MPQWPIPARLPGAVRITYHFESLIGSPTNAIGVPRAQVKQKLLVPHRNPSSVDDVHYLVADVYRQSLR